ncbi:MAG: hypothetical protein K0S11_1450 [Gammaproteobacteria bacterium]|jgi:hypothetical protein|nr:hypothetical protein [Gammaproteobacteria bacterium]
MKKLQTILDKIYDSLVNTTNNKLWHSIPYPLQKIFTTNTAEINELLLLGLIQQLELFSAQNHAFSKELLFYLIEERRFATACYWVSYRYRWGVVGFTKDLTQAKYYLVKAIEYGYPINSLKKPHSLRWQLFSLKSLLKSSLTDFCTKLI